MTQIITPIPPEKLIEKLKEFLPSSDWAIVHRSEVAAEVERMISLDPDDFREFSAVLMDKIFGEKKI